MTLGVELSCSLTMMYSRIGSFNGLICICACDGDLLIPGVSHLRLLGVMSILALFLEMSIVKCVSVISKIYLK